MKNLLVVDDFYSAPEKIRKFASRCEWLQPQALGPKFPGVESRRSYYSSAVVNSFELLINKKIQVNAVTLPFGIFSLGFAIHERNKVIHVDPCEWTGIIYLSMPEYCLGGTGLYRHRRTGLAEVPHPDKLKNLGYKSEEEFFESVLQQDQRRPEAWDLDIFVQMKFNRLVLFKGNSFHAASGYFGSTFENARLIQLFFFTTCGDKDAKNHCD